MRYTETAKNHLKNYVNQIAKALIDNRGIELNSLKELNIFLSDDSGRHEIVGNCSLRIHSNFSREDGTRISNSENISFTPKSFAIRVAYSEDFFGEGYRNNEDRFDNDEEPDSFIEKYLDDSFKNVLRILERSDSVISFDAPRFGVKTKRVKAIVEN